jgi:hypothetical protein
MNILLEAVQYNVHHWNICGDLKVKNDMLVGMQGGFTKFCCWDSRCIGEHSSQRRWEPRKKAHGPGKGSIQHVPLVNSVKMFLPPLHIKFGFFKCLMKAMGKKFTEISVPK